MRILLAQNSLYYPAHGGGDKSNRLLIEALAARGHECRVVARISVFGDEPERNYVADLASRGVRAGIAEGVARFERNGVDVRVVTHSSVRPYFTAQYDEFRPDLTLASTDDPAQQLLEIALRGRVVYMARATLALPFGPDCAFPSEAKTERIRRCDKVVGVSEYVAAYCRRYAALDAVHVPISLMEPEEWPCLGGFDNEFVTLANPCAVKGIGIFLALADAFPETRFAAVPTWGTTEQDRAALRARPNVTVLKPVDDMNDLFRRTRVLLVPSLWAEARSRIVLEAMLRGVPVIAADTGGLSEAKMGVPYLLPVNPIVRYEPVLDAQMVPVPDVPPQDIGPWREALGRLLADRAHFDEISRRSREAALDYARNLNAGPFEEVCRAAVEASRKAVVAPAAAPPDLSDEKKRLLAILLRKRAPAAAWFPGVDSVASARLFWFPHAGGGSNTGVPLPHVAVRLPGRESRLAEAPFERMGPLIGALATAIEPYLAQPFSFGGHSMGAVIAFELIRELRRRGLAMPRILIASAARAPQFRRNHVPPPPTPDRQLLSELNIPAELARAVLPSLRADTTLYRHYIYSEDPPLDVSIRAYGGLDDPNIRREHLDGWREQTTSSFAVRVFPGGHFYLRDAAAAVRAALEEDLGL